MGAIECSEHPRKRQRRAGRKARPSTGAGAGIPPAAGLACGQPARKELTCVPMAARPTSCARSFWSRASNKYAEGSCLARFGDTHVLCTASVENSVPPFLRNSGRGWVTAEYGMLPRATNTRGNREAARGGQSGRTHEIQRLIGRILRAVTDLTGFGERQVKIDCDVHPGRWRHAHRRHHRQLCRPPSRLPLSAADRRSDQAAAARPCRRHLLRHRQGRAAARSRL